MHDAVEKSCSVSSRFASIGVWVVLIRDERLRLLSELTRDVSMQIEHATDGNSIAIWQRSQTTDQLTFNVANAICDHCTMQHQTNAVDPLLQ